MKNLTKNQPTWTKRSNRTLPELPMPKLSSLNTEAPETHRGLGFFLVARPLLATAGFIAAQKAGWWPIAILLTWLVYGSALTAVHHLIHSSVGFSPRARHFWLSIIACLVVESGHALQATHLTHHRVGDDLPDPEGYIENLTWTQMPVGAAKFRYRLMAWGWRHSPRRTVIGLEIAIHSALHITSLLLLISGSPSLWIYLSLIHFASFAFAVLAGKGPQTNYGRSVPTPIVRVSTRLGKILFFSHDKHLEHHAYPKVPLPHLHYLQDEIDKALATSNTAVFDVRMPV